MSDRSPAGPAHSGDDDPRLSADERSPEQAAGMRFLTRYQYIELVGQAECERQLDRVRRRGLPES